MAAPQNPGGKPMNKPADKPGAPKAPAATPVSTPATGKPMTGMPGQGGQMPKKGK